MFFGKSPGAFGKYLKNTVNPAPSMNRRNHNRPQPKCPANFPIDQRIILGIHAMLKLPAAEALTRNPSPRVHLCTKSKRRITAARAAHHNPVLPHRQGRARSASKLSRYVRDRTK
jgi:hypothetical protein